MQRVLSFYLLAFLVNAVALARAETILVSTQAVWKYFDNGMAPPSEWKKLPFDDSMWSSGPAPLGYGNGDEATVLATNAAAKPIATYFRREFFVPPDLTISTLTLRIRFDDATAVYINGSETARLRMSGGIIDATTRANSAVEGVEEGRFIQRGVYYAKPGTNIIAVEVHQATNGLDDAVFDLELIANIPSSGPQINLLAPINGAVVDDGPLTLTANASDADGHIIWVQFLANGLILTNMAQEPYSLAWQPTNFGRYTLSARAVDNTGRAAQSLDVHVQYGQDLVTQLSRGPYLQSGSTTSVVVRWRTDWFAEGWVVFGTNAFQLDRAMTDPRLLIEHEATLTGLLPGTRYFYAIGSAEGPLAGGLDYCFVTAPAAAKPTRIWAIGDFGTQNVSQNAVRDAYYQYSGVGSPSCRNTDVWLMLGDNAYESGSDEEYQGAVFDAYGELLRRSVVWPTLGNHDAGTISATGEYPYFDMFTLPRSGETGGLASGVEKYYSFDFGNIHFVCLDATSSDRSRGGPMLTWLEQDLAATALDWIIAFWHQPPYTFGSHNSDAESDLIQMRENALPILEHYGVDLVLCGHSHVYERSYLLNGHYGFSAALTSSMILNGGLGRAEDGGTYQKPAGGLGAVGGTIYVVCGCSGEGGAVTVRKHPAHAIHLGGFGSLVLDVDGLRLDAKFLRQSGEIEDYFSIVKGLPAEGVRPTLAISPLGHQAAIAWPTSLMPFQLESTRSLSAGLPWTTWPDAPSTVGRSNFVAVGLDGTNRMFRLRSVP